VGIVERRVAQQAARPGRGVKSPGVLAWLRLMRVFTRLDHLAQEQLRCARLSPAQFDVLAQVGVHERCTQQELADALLVTKGNVTQLLDRMEQAGLIARRPEGRTKRVCLTEAGRALRAQVVPAHEAFIAAQLGALTPGEQRALIALLRKLERGLDLTPGPSPAGRGEPDSQSGQGRGT
jgi:DNA-binding MarR family transcriptional regulator